MMIRLYQGSGSSEIILGSLEPPEKWATIRHSACRLLRARKAALAANILESIPFELYEGTNGFGDEFHLLYLNASLEKYVELGEKAEDKSTISAYQKIAQTISEIGEYIRFIAVDLDNNSRPIPVASPTLAITSDVVERSLADAEQLIHSRTATSGVDRIHTAFHGYLRAICAKTPINVPDNAGVTQLFKAIREHHPGFAGNVAGTSDIDRVVRSMSAIVDALNPLRNEASLAHPNAQVLSEPEAMLVINSTRTLLHYLNTKLR